MKSVLTGAALLISCGIDVQDSAKKGSLAFPGAADACYRYNFANAKEQYRLRFLMADIPLVFLLSRAIVTTTTVIIILCNAFSHARY